MIELKNICKTFDNHEVLNNCYINIKDNNVFGLVGTNGAGKSTLLRIIADILRVDEGEILIDGENLYKNPFCKNNIIYISDEQYFFINSDINDLLNYYKLYYDNLDIERAKKFFKNLDLPLDKKIKNFSKGMIKQVFIMIAICANTKYVMLDETFDGLDPVVRQTVKSFIANEMAKRDFTPIIASHNLRELEDICDNICLLHKGNVILSNSLDDMKLDMHRMQLILKENVSIDVLNKLDIIKKEQRGMLMTMTVKGKEEDINNVLKDNCIFFEILPLSLEEIFIIESEALGYEVKPFV